MASQQYTHDSTTVTIQNCLKSSESFNKSKKIRLPKGSWDKKLQKVNKKIKEHKINDNIQWQLSINNQIINPHDVNGFQRILSIIPPPITIKIVQVMFYSYITLSDMIRI